MSNNNLKRPTDIFICSHTMAIKLKQLEENPTTEIVIDEELADYMGIYIDNSMTEDVENAEYEEVEVKYEQ